MSDRKGADLVVKGGTLVTPAGMLKAGVAIAKGKIVAVGLEENLPPAERTIDAEGKYVLPGIVDPEGHPGGFCSLESDLKTETQAALCSGVTTWGIQMGSGNISKKFVEFPQEEHIRPYMEAFPDFYDLGQAYSRLDYYLTPFIMKEMHAQEIPQLAEQHGITSFKYYMHMRGGQQASKPWAGGSRIGFINFDDGTVYLGLENAARIGPPGIVSFHCENWEIARIFEERLKQAGRKDMKSWDERSPHFCEAGHVRTYAYYAKITKTPIYIQHVTTQEAIDEIQRARAEGVQIYGQTSACYLSLDHNVWKINVPLRDRETIEKLWVALQNGLVDCSGTDHVNTGRSREEMEVKGDSWATMSGFPSRVEAYLPVMLSEGVNKGRLTLPRLVEVCCENPARIFGIYPKKGAIRVGSDGDLVIVDLGLKRTVKREMIYSLAGWSVYEGWEMQGWPVMTILRGNVVMEWPAGAGRARILGEPRGQYIARKAGQQFLLE